MKSILPFILISVCLSTTYASIIHVPASQPSIQAGINAAEEGDTVLVAEDTYYENINFRGKAISVASEFIMNGDTSHISRTIIDGSQPSHPDSGAVVSFISGEDTTSIICGFTITGGTGNKVYIPSFNMTEIQGGGIHVYESSAQIQYNKIINNNINSDLERGPMGGGIAALNFESSDKFVIIRNCQISSNNIIGAGITGNAGILIAHKNINYIIENNIISNNKVYCTVDWKACGGGIGIDHALPTNGTMIIRNNLIKGNEVRGGYCFGGGLYIVLWETDEIIYDRDPNPIIYNNIILDNYSDWKGDAISLWIGTYQDTAPSENLDMCPQPAFINNTIVNNRAAKGSGIFCYYSSFLIMNSILWNDLSFPEASEIAMGKTGARNWDSYPNDQNKILSHNSLIRDANWVNFNNQVFALDPLFADTLYRLSENSPAVGMGRQSISIDGVTYQVPDYDFDGNPRPDPIDNLIDIGAFESTYPQVLKAYPISIDIDTSYVKPKLDPIQFTSKIHNPELHNVNVFGRITSIDSSVVDSVELFDDGSHGDGQTDDGLYGGELDPVLGEQEFRLSLGIKDNDKGSYMKFNDSKRVTSIGPVVFKGYRITNAQFGILKLKLKNAGQEATAKDITVELTSTDPNVTKITTPNKNPIDIPAGQIVETNQTFTVSTVGSPDTLYFKVKIYSNGYHFWNHGVLTSIKQIKQELPKKFSLSQNFPNPFNPITNIEYRIPNSEFVTLNIYNVLGQKVATLVAGKQKAGFYTVEWDASKFACGVYYYRLVAGEYVETKKLVVLK